MTSPTSWWWVRHAPIPDAAGRLSGRGDVDCDTRDARSIERLAALLPSDAICVVSPLLRTQQTLAAVVAAGSGLPEPVVEAGFIEQSFGSWEGLTWAEMEQNEPLAYARFWQDPTRNAPPGGESFLEQMQRTAAAVDRLGKQYEGRTIVCFSHGGTIRAAIALALDLTPEQAMSIAIDTLSVTRLDRLPGGALGGRGSCWRVQTVNAPCRWISGEPAC